MKRVLISSLALAVFALGPSVMGLSSADAGFFDWLRAKRGTAKHEKKADDAEKTSDSKVRDGARELAEEPAHFHEVTANAPTLSEISKKLYGRARFWKDIAEWNEIDDPRKLRLGQRLLLKRAPSDHDAGDADWWTYRVGREAPTLSEISVKLYGTVRHVKRLQQWNDIASADRIYLGQELKFRVPPAVTEMARAAPSSHKVETQFRAMASDLIFEVNEDTRTLGMVSLRLYGTSTRWREIAEWNDLGAPYRIHPSQKLVLKRAATLSPAEGDRMVLMAYRKKFGLAD